MIIRWGHVEEADRVMNGKHVHIWIAVMDGNTGQKKRITKRMAYQRLTSALRMCDMDVVDIPYLAPLSNCPAYETYMDKENARDDETSWKTGGITNVAYLRKVFGEVGNDLYRIYRKIHQDTGLPLQKIVSQRAGITAYLDMAKTIKTGSIKKRIMNHNSTGVSMIIDNILNNTEVKDNPSKRMELLTTLLYMSTVDRHSDDGIRAPLLWSTEEGTGKSSTLKVIPESMKKVMVTEGDGQWSKVMVNENAGQTHTYTTPASDNDVIIRWGYKEEAERVMNGDHVHVWLAVMDGNSGQKKRITKRMAYQRLTSALRMCDLDTVDIPYLAPLANRQAYEKYID